MNKPLLVTYRFMDISLVTELQELGINIIFCDNFHDVIMRAHDSIGYFGSLFAEIKRPFSFLILLHKLHKENTPYVFWNRDSPWHCGIKKHRKFLLKALKPVDIYFAHSLQDASWFTSRKPLYFPNGAQIKYISDTLSEELRDPSYYEYDISFIGSIGNSNRLNCKKRKKFLHDLQKIISSYNAEIKFNLIDTYKQNMTIAEQILVIKKSKINLNFGAMCDLPNTPSWGLPERVFGIPAVGGFLLTDWRKTITDTFPEDTCNYFHDLNECADKIIHLLSNFNLTRTYAEKLHNEVVKKHTYNTRATTFLTAIIDYQKNL